MSDAYRDAGGMLRARIEEERAAITELDAAIGDLGRALVEKRTLTEISDLRRSALRYFRTADEAREVLEQSRALRERLEEALVEKRRCFMVDDGYPALPETATRQMVIAAEIEEAFTAALLPATQLVAWGYRGATTSFVEDGVPIRIGVECSGSSHKGWIGVRMPPTLPALHVHPEGLGDILGQWLGLVKDIEVDDSPFDERYRLRGSKVVAEIVMTKGVRDLLRRLHPFAGGLTIGDGTAAYAWEAPAKSFPITHGVRVLVELRRALASAATV